MAAPIYNTDLIDITLAESVTNWTALGGGASGLAIGPDFAMQGINCVDKAVSVSEKGQVFNFGTTITPGTNTHFYTWVFLATPGVSATLANRGLTVAIGTSTTAYNQFHVEGSDTYGAIGRVGKCYPVRYVTTSTSSAAQNLYRTLVGTPGANPQYFGSLANILGTVKGSNLGVDAIRYGTGIYNVLGDTTTPITFSGSAAANDATGSRWGVFTYVSGNSYELQGRYGVGLAANGTTTASYMLDTGKSILFTDTKHSLSDFTQFIVDHPSTTCSLSNISFTAGGTINRGIIKFNNSASLGNLSSCTFDGIGNTQLQARVSASNSTWNNCLQVTQSSATINSCTFNKTTLISNEPNKVSYCKFFGNPGVSGSHGIVVTRTGSYAFAGNTFENFGGNNTTSASLFNNSGGVVTMSIVAGSGGGTPTFFNSAGSSTFIQNAVLLSMNIVDATGTAVTSSCEVTVVKESDTSILFAEENVISGNSQYLYNYTADTLVYINILNVSSYEPKTVTGVTLTSTNQSITIQLDDERGKYSNP